MVSGPCCGCAASSPDEITELIVQLQSPRHLYSFFDVESLQKVVNVSTMFGGGDVGIVDWLRKKVVYCIYAVVNPSHVVIENVEAIFEGSEWRDLMLFGMLCRKTRDYFNEQWQTKAYELFNGSLASSEVDQLVQRQNSTHCRLVLTSGILYIQPVMNAVQEANRKRGGRHLIYDIPIPGSPIRRRLLVHPAPQDKRCTCFLDGVSSLNLTSVYESNDPLLEHKILTTPFSPTLSRLKPFLRSCFTLYRNFLLSFDKWDRFLRLGSANNLDELATTTEDYLKAFSTNHALPATDDILFGLHFTLLSSLSFRQYSLEQFNCILNINFHELLLARSNPTLIAQSQSAWESKYKHPILMENYKSELVRGRYRTCCSLYMVAQALRKTNKSFDEIYESYIQFLGECSEKPGENITCPDLLTDVLYHIHLLHPARFRNDCILMFNSVIDHSPELLPDDGVVIWRHPRSRSDALQLLRWDDDLGVRFEVMKESLEENHKWSFSEKYGRLLPERDLVGEYKLRVYLTLERGKEDEGKDWGECNRLRLSLKESSDPKAVLQAWEANYVEGGYEGVVPKISRFLESWRGQTMIFEEEEEENNDGSKAVWWKVGTKGSGWVWGIWRCVLNKKKGRK